MKHAQKISRVTNAQELDERIERLKAHRARLADHRRDIDLCIEEIDRIIGFLEATPRHGAEPDHREPTNSDGRIYCRVVEAVRMTSISHTKFYALIANGAVRTKKVSNCRLVEIASLCELSSGAG
jgi:hypothetical protein